MPTLAVSPASLHRLRQRLLAAGDATAASILHEAGFATGEAMARRWHSYVERRTGMAMPAELDMRWFGQLLADLCEELGWGRLTVEELDSGAMTCSSRDWSEAESGTSKRPSCHFTAGILAAFFTSLAESSVGVLETECRSSGDDCCRFLVGSPEVIAAAYDLVLAGGHWADAAGRPAPGITPPSA
jgi:predicted hydrocarbon binding protein